ncbi:uncharacterized protein LOC126322575 [Schistocerca gregaria]|uniref:uncharacterized protein LOC126322575 n=1 Tax=Schistocerca gregaria TaxID=7010 RepID=UPI00211DAA92|nr:uncharacterized protein LOC126322575 [Schistocerca gregaria]
MKVKIHSVTGNFVEEFSSEVTVETVKAVLKSRVMGADEKAELDFSRHALVLRGRIVGNWLTLKDLDLKPSDFLVYLYPLVPQRLVTEALPKRCSAKPLLPDVESMVAEDAKLDQELQDAAHANKSEGPSRDGPGLEQVDPRVRVLRRIRAAIEEGKCTLSVTSTEYYLQKRFDCYTCGLQGDQGCCESCLKNCHRGHLLSSHAESKICNFFCDCPLVCECKCYNSN